VVKRRALNKAQRLEIYGKTGGRCAYCGAKIEYSNMQADHVAPFEFAEIIEKYGFDPNSIENYLPSCRSCNYIKSSMPIEKFRNQVKEWIPTLERDSVTYRNAVRFGMVIPNPHRVEFYFEKLGISVPDYLNGLNDLYRRHE
jgi:5-methylcytosine-specific restriction endonuclease McrA